MINSFEGNYKPRRNINLGGQRKREDLGTLIKKTQELRSDRSLERQRQKSATKIQAFYRGRTVAGRLRNQERALWDQQVETIFNLDNSMYYAAKTLVNIARSFLFFYRPIYDNRREFCLCEILWKRNLNSEMIFIPFSYDELRDTWTLQLKKILLIFLRSVGSQSIIDNNNNYAIHYLKTLLLAVDVEKHEQPTYGGSEIFQDILKYLINHDLYFELRKHLLSLNIEDKNDLAIIPIINLGLYSFRIFNPKDKIYKLSLEKFITDIFTIPLLSHRINIEALSILSSRMPLHDLIVMLSEMNGNNWKFEQGSVLLCNLLVFAHRTIKKMNKDVMLAYLKVIQNLLLLIPPRLLMDKPESDVVVNSDEDSDDEVIVQETTSSFPKIDPRILKGISYLFDPLHLNSLFAFSKEADYTALLKISNFLMILINRWSSRKADLLHSIISGTLSMSENISPIRLLWEAFKKSKLAKILPASQSLPINHFTEPLFSEQWGLFILLCELFSRVLVTMGDDEFFNENQNPLKLSEIIEMTNGLKNVGFTLYWNSPSFKMDSTIHGGCISFIYLREIVTKLLRQIHARDSRRRFTAPDHWLMISESDMATFAKTVVAEDLELERNHDGVNIDKCQLISISPRLGILYNIPFVIPFDERVKIFRNFVRNDRERIHDFGFFEPRRRVTIRRSHIFEDGYANLNSAGKGLKNSVAIQFIDEFGIQEAGIDGGGLFKEFLTSLTRIAFDTNYGLFLNTNKQLLYPNPHEYAQQETQLGYYEFIGRILGKALYEGILIDAAFAGFFLTKWLGRTSYLDDLPSLDPELYQGLIILKNYQGNVESDFSLNFTVVDNEFGESRTIELVPGGSDIPVNQYNRLQYIYLMTNYRLNIQIEKQCKAFFRGLSDLINSKWLKMFNQQELQILVGGAYIPIDLDDLRLNTVYSDYKDDDPVIQNFWKVVSEFSEEEKRNLIKFVTSCSRPPLFGFKELNPKFSIRRAGSGIRLPSSSTCVNLLKLPAYPDENTLREKLMYAINADVGFDLS